MPASTFAAGLDRTTAAGVIDGRLADRPFEIPAASAEVEWVAVDGALYSIPGWDHRATRPGEGAQCSSEVAVRTEALMGCMTRNN